MSYQPTFYQNPKGTFEIDDNFIGIQAASEGYLLENEFNELQWIQNEQKAQSNRSMVNSGLVYNFPTVSKENNSENNTINIVNRNSLLWSIRDYVPVNMNGYPFRLCGTYRKNAKGQPTDYNNILINLSSNPPITDPVKELVFLEFWFEKITVNENENLISKYGGNGNDTTTFEVDSRLDLETTRRIQIKWEIKSARGVTDLSQVSTNGSKNKYVKTNSISGKEYSLDDRLYKLDLYTPEESEKLKPKNIGNVCFAIPLFIVNRTSGDITTEDIELVFPKTQIYISNIKSTTITFGDEEYQIIFEVNEGDLIIKNQDGDLINIKVEKVEAPIIEGDQISALIYRIYNESRTKFTQFSADDDGTLHVTNTEEKYGKVEMGHLVSDVIDLRDSSNTTCTLTASDETIKMTKNNSQSEFATLMVGDVVVNDKNENKINLVTPSDTDCKNKINVYHGSDLQSSINYDGSASGKKVWSITTDETTNKIATINNNNILCDNIGNRAEVAVVGGKFESKPEPKGLNKLYVGTNNKKIYYDFNNDGSFQWIDIGRPSDLPDCDSNFSYDTKAPGFSDSASKKLFYNGYFYANRVYNAVYNDYAEYFKKNTEIEPGDVVICGTDDNYIKSNEKYSRLVVGVCSDTYGHLLGGEGKESDELNYAPIGLSGRVNVKVIGNIKKGDLLVTSDIPGVAMASNEYIPGTVIGKALEEHDSYKIKRISMLIVNM